MAAGAPAAAHRHPGPGHRRRGAAREQPGLPDRRVRLHAAVRQAPPAQVVAAPAGRADEALGPGCDRGLRRPCRARSASHLRGEQERDPLRDRQARGGWLHRRWRRAPARLRGCARTLQPGREQPGDSRQRRRLQRGAVERRGDDPPHRKGARVGRLSLRPGFRHRQPAGLEDGAAGQPRERQLRLHRQRARGREGAGERVRRHPLHDCRGREAAGGVQSPGGAGVPAHRLREPCVARGGFCG